MSHSDDLFAPIRRLLARKPQSPLIEQVRDSMLPDEFENLEWDELLALMTQSFRLVGYRPSTVNRLGLAPGADLLMRRGSFKLLVRCREWRDFRVGKEAIVELHSAMQAHRTEHAVVLTNGRFTTQAQQLSQRYGIDLVEGPRLLNMLRSARSSFNGAIIDTDSNQP